MSIDFVFPKGKKKALTFSYDDGVEADLPLADIFNACGMKGTFNICGSHVGTKGHLSAEEIRTNLLAKGHEVACHGFRHPFEDQSPAAAVVNDVLEDRKILEEVTGGIVRGMAYPFGTYNQQVIDILKSLGIVYCRATQQESNTTKIPYGDGWLAWNPTTHHNGDIVKRIQPFLEYPWGCRLLYIWGHSYEFNNMDNWEVMEEFCEKMKKRREVWYATNIEIYDYVEASRRLHISANCKMIHNPSAIPVWIRDTSANKIREIEPGATITL